MPYSHDDLDEELFTRVEAARPLGRMDLIRSGRVMESVDLEGRLEFTLHSRIMGLRTGDTCTSE